MATASRFRLPVPLPTATSHPWLTLHNLGEAAHGLVAVFTVVDFAMAGAYAWLLWRLLERVATSGVMPDKPPLGVVTRPRPWTPWAAAGLDALENVFLLSIVLSGSADAPMAAPLAVGAVLCTFGKWVFLALSVLPLLFAGLGTVRGRARCGRWLRALTTQRFSLLAVVPIAALALVPGPGVFDQLPDVQRAWLEIGDGRGWSGPWHAAWAIGLLGLVTFGLFILGRLLTDDALNRSGGGDGPPPRTLLWQWLYGPVLIVALGLWSVASGGQLRLAPMALFVGIPLGIAGVSWWLRAHRRDELAPPEPANAELPVSEIWRMGDMLALSAVVVASLGLVRSYVVVLVLGLGNVLQWVMPLAGLASAVLVWVFGSELLARVGDAIPLVRELIHPAFGANLNLRGEADARPPQEPEQRKPWLFGWACIIASTVSLTLLTVWPAPIAAAVGVLGAMMLALGSLTLLVGASVAVNALWLPPEVFWLRWFRLTQAPVGALVLIVVAAASVTGSTPDVHGLRTDISSAASGVGYPDAVEQWRDRVGDCLVDLGDGRLARPMVFVAAEGGGIRAAYWTAATLDALDTRADCSTRAVAFASGVSGGSVGLAVARTVPMSQASDAVWRLSGGDALAEATLGLLVRDPVFTVAGVPALTDGQWLDRAALMETAWERAVPGLAADFYAPATDGGFPAPLVLNSTDATSGCRVLATQLLVGGDTEAAVRCTDDGVPLPYSRDLRVYLNSDGGGPERPDDSCLPGVRLSTAAMLSARFPYVTPSAVIGPCRGTNRAQLIDGGYAEGSGLGTVVDLAPNLLTGVAEDPVPVLPIVVFLDNGRGGDLLPVTPETRPEILVPPMGAITAGGTQKSTAAWLQRSLAALDRPNQPAPGKGVRRRPGQRARGGGAARLGVVPGQPKRHGRLHQGGRGRLPGAQGRGPAKRAGAGLPRIDWAA